jgi:hypothetical protein
MKIRRMFYLGIPLLAGAAMLFALQNSEKHQPPEQRIQFTVPGECSGRPLTPEERATIQQAIDSIRTPPPSSITYSDAFGFSETVSCETIANALQKQLD